MRKAFRRAGRRLRKAAVALVDLPFWLWRFAVTFADSRDLRQHAFGQALVAGVFAFGLWSADFLLTGGMDWSPDMSAIAAEPSHTIRTSRAQDGEPVAPPPALTAPALQRLDEMAAPNEDLLGGPDTVLAAWSRPRPERALPVKHAPVSAGGQTTPTKTVSRP